MSDILAAFADDGLAVAPLQDNTAIACADAPCVQVMEIEQEHVSIWEFKTPSEASRWASIYPWTHTNGRIMLRFTRDGLHPTPPDAAASYSQSLDNFMARE